MKETEERTAAGDELTGVPPTDADRGNRQQTAPEPVAKRDVETVDIPQVPPTDPGPDHGKGSLIGGVRADGAGDATESLSASPSDPITAPPEPGGATADATACLGDRDATADFALDSRFADPESTLAPSPDERPYGLPRIGGYDVEGVLGEGGMGIVYKARHRRLNRPVALKMIKGAAGDRSVVRDRFEAEARAVASIDHPNIVKIFEIGEHDGQPYFSLEFLGGGNLARKLAAKPQPAAEAARIVEVLARAVSVAHQQRIIHRDLKPANVLLGVDGTLKISDFGLVKQLEDESGQTMSGVILGTPCYMAPEQARGELRNIGPAADQYALGAILYELLTGRPPFQGMSTLDTLDMVRGKDPIPPSQLQPRMHPDIETICLKCLQKEPERRYADVLALAEDLRRFQAGEPIVARPVSGAERLKRWCLRNKKLARLYAAVALLGVTLVGVFVGSFIIVIGQKDDLTVANAALAAAKKLADDRRVEAETQQQVADDKRKLAETAARAANEQNQSAVEAQLELIRLLERQLRYVPAIQNIRDELLDKAAGRLVAAARAMTNLRKDIGWDPKDEAHNWRTLARAERGLAELYLSRNQFDQAMKHLHESDEIIGRLAAAAPTDLDLQVIWLRSRRFVGFVAMNKLGHNEEAQDDFRQAIRISRECLAKKPDSDTYKSELANSLGHLAISELRLGHLAKARDLFGEEIATRKSFSPAQAKDRETRRELSGLYEQVAELNLRLGDTAEGRRLYDECAAIRKEVAVERPDFWPIANDLARSYNNEGMVRFPYSRDPAAARDFHRKAIEVYEKRVKDDPADFDAKSRLAQTLYYEATCALHSGDAPGASAGYRRCLEIYKKLATEPKAKVSQSDLMLALARCGEHVEAARIASALLATPPTDEHHYFQTAGGFALAAGAARGDHTSVRQSLPAVHPLLELGGDAKGDDALVKRYTDAAVLSLRKGKERGWTDVVSLEIDPDLEPIRKDPTFQTLVAELRQVKEKRP